MANRTIIEIGPPVLGKNDTIARTDQPPRSTPDCLNVIPYNRNYRRIIGARGGATAVTLGSGSITSVAAIGQITLNVSGSLTSKLVVIGSDGRVFVDGAAGVAPSDSISGNIAFSPGQGGIGYMTGSTSGVGSNVRKIDFTSVPAVITTLAGTTPSTDIFTSCVWRNRLVIAGRDQTWAMSRVGSHDDFTTTGTDPADPARPMSGSVTDIHQAIDAPIVALIPFTEDRLLVGGDRRFWEFRGDPADGGHILVGSESTGIASRKAWCIAPDGLYVVGSGGLFRFNGADFEAVSPNKLAPYFRAISRSTEVSLQWDKDKLGIWIFSSGGSMFFDFQDQGFWPQTLGVSGGASITTSYVYDGPLSTDRVQYYGDSTGVVWKQSDTAAADSGAFFWLGPVVPFGLFKRGRMLSIDVILGDTPGGGLSASGSVGVYGGSDPAAAMAASPVSVSFSAGGRQSRTSIRTAAACFMLKVNTSNAGFERAVMEFVEAGDA